MNRKQIAGYSGVYISPDEMLTDNLLSDLYDSMAEGEHLFIEQRGKNINFETDGIKLIKNGFGNIVKMKKSLTKGCYIIHCIRTQKKEQLLSVIVPLYNEENTANELLKSLINRKWTMPVEFVLVESNSKDRTREIALSYKDYPNVKVILEDKPQGKGNGVLNGIRHASGNYIAIQDGDLEYDVNDYDKLLEPIINYETLFMLGSRYKKDDWHMRKFGKSGRIIANYLNIGQVLLTWILNTACGCKLTDPFTTSIAIFSIISMRLWLASRRHRRTKSTRIRMKYSNWKMAFPPMDTSFLRRLRMAILWTICPWKPL